MHFNEEAAMQKLMPKSGKIYDFEFGPHKRMEDETFQDYRFRRKVESHVLKYRVNNGINAWPSNEKGVFIDPAKQQRKAFAKMKKAFLKLSFRDYQKANFNAKMPQELIVDIKSSWDM